LNNVALSEHRPGIFFIIVGPAGVGKNRLIEFVVNRVEGLRQLATATTRPMRPGEQQGREHVFVTKEEFDRFISMGALLEHQLVHGVHYYGILSERVEAALYAGDLVIADIEVHGARIAREAYPDNTVTIFIQPPSVLSLVERMRTRNEPDAEIARRLMRVPMEMQFANEADYIVVNDDLEHAANTLTAIITAECSRPSKQDASRAAYTYAAQVIPCWGGEALRRDSAPRYPTTIIKEGEPPHVAAARALNKAFGAALPAGEWIYGEGAEADFVPPVTVETATGAGGDQVIFVYQYRMNERINPPEGWTWAA
jgi:guanylate kinase